jgi:predicted ATP-dependent endonuclease of OLD family
MRIAKVRIHNYRSFKDISVNLSPYTVIVGQNNVGKSNILRAIELFFSPPRLGPRQLRRPFYLNRPSRMLHSRYSRYRREGLYDYQRDFPVNLQSNPGKKCTLVTISFILEKKDFEKLGLLRKFERFKSIDISQFIRAAKDKTENVEYRSNSLTGDDLNEFLDWLFSTSDFVRIPSSRASEASQDLLRSFTNRIFANLSGSYNVKRALESLATKAKQEIGLAEKSILLKLEQFIPELESVSLDIGELPEISEILGISNIKINDGTLTYLSNKGDGVQSLFFIGLMQYSASLKVNRNLIFGIEEPELHLHPEAQEELAKTLKSIAETHQVILTTHSPVLVNRSNFESNIVVRKHKQTIESINTSSLFTIRDVLGVKPSHNLENARLVTVVEGATELRLVGHILTLINKGLNEVMRNGELRIVLGKGAKGVVNYLQHFTRELQPCLALFDNDQEGLEGHTFCLEHGILEAKDLFLVSPIDNRSETEIEDLFLLEYTVEALKKSLNIEISIEQLKNYILRTGHRKKKPGKWGIVVENILKEHGRSGQEEILNKVKEAWVDVVIKNIKIEQIPAVFHTLNNRLIEVLKLEKVVKS